MSSKPGFILPLIALSFSISGLGACELSQDLGDSSDAGAASTGDGATSANDSGSPRDGSTSAFDGSSSKDASTSDAAPANPCPAPLAGYPAATGFYGTWTGTGNIPTNMPSPILEQSPSGIVDAAFWDSTFSAPIANHWGGRVSLLRESTVNPGFDDQYDLDWWLPELSDPTIASVGTAYEMHFVFRNGPFYTTSGEQDDTVCPSTGVLLSPDDTGPKACSYPGTAGSCTLTVDAISQGASCVNARISCTGLVGANSGAAFGITNGKLVIMH
ncbi:MAG: hypothetical protein ABI183_13725 [Polyangiaceae bacterium]